MNVKNKVIFKFAGVCIIVGAILCIVGMTGGAKGVNAGNYYENNTRSVDTSNFGQIDSLDFDIEVGSLMIQSGNRFKVEHNYKNNYVDVKVDNGALVIKTKVPRLWGFNIGFNRLQHGTIIVTVPKESNFDSVSISMGAGEAIVDVVNAQKGSFEVGAGRFRIDSLTTTQLTKFEAGVGELIINNMDAANAEVNCGVGSATLKGKMSGLNKIDCAVGDIKLYLDGDASDYYFKAESGIGKVEINNNSTVIGESNSGNPNAPVKVEISCGVGKVSVWNQ